MLSKIFANVLSTKDSLVLVAFFSAEDMGNKGNGNPD
jgi:hypothetical protein